MAAMRVMVVDDHEDIRELVAEVLVEDGYDVCVAHDGVEALRQLEAEPRPDIMLVDMMMPGLSGRDLIQRLRGEKRYDGTLIVAVSAAANARRDMKGFDAFLAKPFDLDNLRDIVQGVAARINSRDPIPA
jgi:CheY-like chemotaxis protein